MTAEPNVQFARPEEWQPFAHRHAEFFQIWPRLRVAIEKVFNREFNTDKPEDRVIYTLARLIVEDFMEIMLVCGNGYGIAGLKLLRTMFERTVTMIYLAHHPNETDDFLEYRHVYLKRALAHAKDAASDLNELLSEEQQKEIEAEYARVKARFTETNCPKCKSTRDQFSSTKKGLPALAKDRGLDRAYLSLYFWPMLQTHPTVFGISSRMEVSDAGFIFRPGAQEKEADYALRGAHLCLQFALEEQEGYFHLGLDVDQIRGDFVAAWAAPSSGRPDNEGPSRS